MKQTLPMLTILAALAGPCFAAGTGPHGQAAAHGQATAGEMTAGQATAGQATAGQAAPGSTTAPASQGPAKVCLDAQAGDALIRQLADQLREVIAASGTLSVASAADACNLQLHVPGNLLRFQTASGVMVSTVVIVTAPSGRYLSTSINACEASDLKPCAIRAIAAAKLALLVSINDGS